MREVGKVGAFLALHAVLTRGLTKQMLNKAFLPGGWIISYPPIVMEQLLCHLLDNPLKWELLSSPLFKKGNGPSRPAGVPAYTAMKSPHTIRLCVGS